MRYGLIEEAVVYLDEYTQTEPFHLGMGTVKYFDPANARKALATMDGNTIFGQKLSIVFDPTGFFFFSFISNIDEGEIAQEAVRRAIKKRAQTNGNALLLGFEPTTPESFDHSDTTKTLPLIPSSEIPEVEMQIEEEQRSFRDGVAHVPLLIEPPWVQLAQQASGSPGFEKGNPLEKRDVIRSEENTNVLLNVS